MLTPANMYSFDVHVVRDSVFALFTSAADNAKYSLGSYNRLPGTDCENVYMFGVYVCWCASLRTLKSRASLNSHTHTIKT